MIDSPKSLLLPTFIWFISLGGMTDHPIVANMITSDLEKIMLLVYWKGGGLRILLGSALSGGSSQVATKSAG